MFLNLFCAVTICSTNTYAPFVPKARDLFNEFIENHINEYGEDSIVSNIHLLNHVVDDVEHYGELNTFNAYAFENSLHHLKLNLKQCRRPLEQIVRRIQEASSIECKYTFKIPGQKTIVKHEFMLPGSSELAYRYIEYNSKIKLSAVSDSKKNRYFLTLNGSVVEFDYAIKIGNGYKIHGSALKTTSNFFEKPFLSKYINIHFSDGEKIAPQYYELSAVKAKLFCLPYKNEFVYIPLLHTI